MSLLMEALKKAEREKQKNAPGESLSEEGNSGMVTPPIGAPAPDFLQGESSFPSLEWPNATPSDDTVTVTAPLPTEPSLSLEPIPDPESNPAAAIALPPTDRAEPYISPSAELPQPTPPPQNSISEKEPDPVITPEPQPQNRLHNTAAAGKKPHLQKETTTSQRQQYAAHVLAAKKKATPSRSRLLPAVISVAASFLLAGVAYLYLQHPQLFSIPNLDRPSPPPVSPPTVVAEKATVAPSPLPEPPSSPPPALTATETLASNASPAEKQQISPAPAPLPAEQTMGESAITIRRSTHKEQVAPALTRGYSAFMAGNNDLAQQEYSSILRQDGNNRDALLGMAAIAAKHGRSDEAVRTYLRLLNLDPRDAAAQAGMLSLTAGQADPVQSESRIKMLLTQQPDAHYLHFALANLYASQSRWSEAQQEFFHAYQSAPNNPDYLYNLAISLDHLNQGKLALEYYQRALALSQKGSANFDKSSAQNRIKELQLPATH